VEIGEQARTTHAIIPEETVIRAIAIPGRFEKMTLTLELQPAEVAALDARARAMGMDMAAVLHDLIAQIATTERPLYETATLDEWERKLDELSDDVDPAVPPIPDEALRRDSLYESRVR
jgi:predicted transcriptional regulator